MKPRPGAFPQLWNSLRKMQAESFCVRIRTNHVYFFFSRAYENPVNTQPFLDSRLFFHAILIYLISHFSPCWDSSSSQKTSGRGKTQLFFKANTWQYSKTLNKDIGWHSYRCSTLFIHNKKRYETHLPIKRPFLISQCGAKGLCK